MLCKKALYMTLKNLKKIIDISNRCRIYKDQLISAVVFKHYPYSLIMIMNFSSYLSALLKLKMNRRNFFGIEIVKKPYKGYEIL